jgi:hypothetical protein
MPFTYVFNFIKMVYAFKACGLLLRNIGLKTSRITG